MALELPACVKKFVNLWDERSQECIDFFMMFNSIFLQISIKRPVYWLEIQKFEMLFKS
jgi:hypothetical protein